MRSPAAVAHVAERSYGRFAAARNMGLYWEESPIAALLLLLPMYVVVSGPVELGGAEREQRERQHPGGREPDLDQVRQPATSRVSAGRDMF